MEATAADNHATAAARKVARSESPLVTATEVAELLGVTTRVVFLMAESGRLPRLKFGRRTVRFRLRDVAALLRESESG